MESADLLVEQSPDRPASPDGDQVERPTGRTTWSRSGEARSPCGARRVIRGGIAEEGRGSERSPEVFKGLINPSVAGAARARAAVSR